MIKLRSKGPLKQLELAELGLLGLCLMLFFWQLDGYSLFNITEAKQAEIARQIWVRHDWITPFYNGEIYFDKPILLHWLIALGYAVCGFNEWAVRLPSAISAMVLMVITWLFVARFATRRMALLTTTILAVNPLTFALGRTGQHDMLMVCFVTGALYSWFLAYSMGKRWGYLASFALLGLAILVKGPLALALSGLAIALFLIYVGQWREQLKATPWRSGLLIFGGITLPWYGLVIWANGWTFASKFFLYNNVDRFVTPNLNQVGPWYYYLPLLLISFFPWVGLLPGVWAKGGDRAAWLRPRYWQHQSPTQQISLFMAIWAIAVLGFMSVAATKLPWYVYPAYPAIAYLCAHAWEQQLVSPNRWLRSGLALIGGVYLVLGIGVMLLPHLLPQEPILQRIHESGTLQLWALVFAVAAIACWLSAMRQQAEWLWPVGVIIFGIIALSTIHQLSLLDRPFLGGRLLAIANSLHQETCDACDGDITLALGVNEPSLNFYSRLSIIRRFDQPFDRAAIQAQLDQPKRILLVTTDDYLRQAGLDFSQQTPTYSSGVYKLFIKN